MPKTKIVFLLLPHMHLLDLAGPDQVFHEALEYGAEIEVHYCSIDKTISTSSLLGIEKLKSFTKVRINSGDYIMIPGADVSYLVSSVIPFEKEIADWLHDAHLRGAYICSICTGAFFLARVGLLNNRKCTTHWKRTKELKKRYPCIELVEDILYTEDDKILTSAGVTAGIDLALYIVERLKGDHFSFKIARELVVYMRRHGNDLQQSAFMNYRNHIHSGVHTVQDYIQENIQKRLTLDKLGRLANMSERNLTRIFKKETGITINEYITIIRKAYLHKLLANPDITRKQMATLCGLKSERQVIRLLREIDS